MIFTKGSKLIEKVNAVNWKDRVMPGGFNGEVGLKLDQLEAVVKQALCQYEVSNYKIDHVEVTHADATALKMFRHALAANEKNGRDYILIHFLQDVVTEAQGGPYPHICQRKRRDMVWADMFGLDRNPKTEKRGAPYS